MQLSKYLHPNCSHYRKSRPVVVLALFGEQALELYSYAINERWEWTNVVWIGSESVSVFAAMLPDYFGATPKIDTDAKAYKDLADFWSTEAPDIDGFYQLSQVLPQGRVGGGRETEQGGSVVALALLSFVLTRLPVDFHFCCLSPQSQSLFLFLPRALYSGAVHGICT